MNESKKVKILPSYKDRVYFNNESFSLTLKNMQKTDSGLYTASASGESEENIATYRVSVIGECDMFRLIYDVTAYTLRQSQFYSLGFLIYNITI